MPDDTGFVGPSPEGGHELRSDAAELFSGQEGDGRAGLRKTPGFTLVCPDCDRQVRFVEPLRAQAWVVGHYNAEHPDTLPRFSNTGTES